MARGGRGRILEAETEREKNLTQRRGGRGVEAEEERKKGRKEERKKGRKEERGIQHRGH
jgi:hypothetical protein